MPPVLMMEGRKKKERRNGRTDGSKEGREGTPRKEIRKNAKEGR